MKILFALIFCAGTTLSLQAQLGGGVGYVRLKSFQRIAYQNKPSLAWSGAALAGGYQLMLNRKHRWDVGAEIGFLEWGGQALYATGPLLNYKVHRKITLHTGLQVYNGLVFFRPKPLYTVAGEWQGGLTGKVDKWLDMGLFLGVRYSNTPKYRLYSSVNSYWHFSVEWVFFIRKPKPHHGIPNPSF